MICSFIFGAMGVPYPNSGGLGVLDVPLAGGVSFGVKLLAAVGLAWDGAVVGGLVLLAAGRAQITAAEEGFGMLAGWWTTWAWVVWGVRGWAHDAAECVSFDGLVNPARVGVV